MLFINKVLLDLYQITKQIKMIMKGEIKNILDEIKEQLGIELSLYDGLLKTFKGKKYFDIQLNDSCWCSSQHDKLIRYCEKHNTFTIEQTGYKRVGIFLI